MGGSLGTIRKNQPGTIVDARHTFPRRSGRKIRHDTTTCPNFDQHFLHMVMVHRRANSCPSTLRRRQQVCILVLLLIFTVFTISCNCLTHQSRKTKLVTRRDVLLPRGAVTEPLPTAVAAAAVAIFGGLFVAASPAQSKDDTSVAADILSSLQDATPSRPPIPLPQNYQKSTFSVEGK